MLKIRQFSKFKKDYEQYCRDINVISNDNIKNECYELLNKLVEQLNIIDAAHDTINTSMNPTRIRENVECSVQLRLQLNKLIKNSKN